MNAPMEFIRKMPLPQEIRKECPADEKILRVKENRDQAIANVLTGKVNATGALPDKCRKSRMAALKSCP